jgi:hypothetical protein
MKLHFVTEPDLQFCDGTHIDIRAGIAQYGALDRDARKASPLRIGIVATPSTEGPLRRWLDQCSQGIQSKETKLIDLRPNFPGLDERTFGSRLEITDGTVRAPSARDLEQALKCERPMDALVEIFYEHAKDLAARGNLDLLIIAPSTEICDLGDALPLQASRLPAEMRPLDDGSEPQAVYRACFHDLLKAKALRLPIPSQFIRPDTYEGGKTKRGKGERRIQDEATRAWNFFTALYYKAGAVPWRLVRDSSALTSCYIGISFFRTLDKKRVLSSVAQIFDERGEGLVVLGALARIDSDDRSPHLAGQDIAGLLGDTLKAYKREHKTLPARLVVHKTSRFDDDELAGARSVLDTFGVEILDLVNVRRSGVRLFRDGTYPVLRGTSLAFDDRSGIVYLRGSVPQFRTYPGMYVPSALEFEIAHGDIDVSDVSRELMALSKLNFNSTQFDCSEPATVRAARRVGDIVKHVPEGEDVRLGFRFFT